MGDELSYGEFYSATVNQTIREALLYVLNRAGVLLREGNPCRFLGAVEPGLHRGYSIAVGRGFNYVVEARAGVSVQQPSGRPGGALSPSTGVPLVTVDEVPEGIKYGD